MSKNRGELPKASTKEHQGFRFKATDKSSKQDNKSKESPGKWMPFHFEGPYPTLKRLNIISYNMLFSFYDKGELASQERYQEMGRRMKELYEKRKVHVIGIQEVAQDGLKAILSWKWVRKNFLVSHREIGEGDYGQILLSRIPFKALIDYKLSAKKMVCMAQLEGGKEYGPISMANIHLTSNARGNQVTKRFEQLDHVFSLSKKHSRKHNLIFGDFNSSDESDLDHIQHSGYMDMWKLFHGKKEGLTFVPPENPTAKLTSMSGKSRRFDKMLVKSNLFTPKSIEIFGKDWLFKTEKGETLNCSDHYGILFCCRLD